MEMNRQYIICKQKLYALHDIDIKLQEFKIKSRPQYLSNEINYNLFISESLTRFPSAAIVIAKTESMSASSFCTIRRLVTTKSNIYDGQQHWSSSQQNTLTSESSIVS